MITLVGKELAKEGLEFQYVGPLMECRACKLKNVCFNLDEGKWYRVVKVRDKEHECKVHEGGKVVTVEVEEIPVPLLLDVKTVVEGEVIEYHRMNCHGECDDPTLCRPIGLRDGTKIKIVKIEGKVKCGNKEFYKVLVTW
ncbi:MAG: UPF0179 family protein [Euryarchaeota archaeon]|nr:UPF0179 family protein [Euryarchaeota archaeon]